MDWDFTENIAFKSLFEAFKECDETSATEFLASDGASFYLELIQFSSKFKQLKISANSIQL